MEPVYWDEVLERGPANERERAFLEEFRKADLGDGVGIPVPRARRAKGVRASGSQGVRRLDPEALKEFQWVCELAHLRYCALLVPQLGPLPELSPRETEVLAWVARGKSNPLIAEISGSRHTVDAHLRRIYLKLGVFDRISAPPSASGSG